MFYYSWYLYRNVQSMSHILENASIIRYKKCNVCCMCFFVIKNDVLDLVSQFFLTKKTNIHI